MTPKLSIVMATADDFDGVYFTIQALRMFHPCADVEFVVVDNKPLTAAGRRLRADITGGKYGPARYIEFSEIEGTAAPRERAIREARGKYVICLDAHVMLAAGAIEKLLAYFDEHPETNDLLTGPLLHDPLKSWETHFNAVWRGEMLGIWGKAWELSGQQFSVIEDNDKCRYIRMDAGNELLDAELTLPVFGYAGHEAYLRTSGCRQLGADSDVFEIPGMGCGLMAFRKDAWPGFNPDFRGFGGEEMYIHEKFRRAGGKCLCLGFLKWLHRFGRPGGVPYRLSSEDKCRNYILGHLELDLDLEPVRQHFVGLGKVTERRFAQLVEQIRPPVTTTTTTTTPAPKPQPKGYGPGTQLQEILAGMGINPSEKCGCRKVARLMDDWGVEKCRQQREFLKTAIQGHYEKWGWKDKLALVAAGTLSVLTGGVAWEMKDKLDPVGSMLDLAIDREAERLKVQLPEASEPAVAEAPVIVA